MATTDGTTDCRPLGDHETILPGDVFRTQFGECYPAKDSVYSTPRECEEAWGLRRTWYRPIPRPAPAAPEPTSDTDPVFRPVDIITIAYDILPGGALVLPSDMVTLDGVKMELSPHSLVGQRVDRAKHFGVRAVMRRRDEPPQPEPAIDPGARSIRGEVTTLRWGDNHLVTVTADGKMPFRWTAGMRAEVTVWSRHDAPPLTPDDIHRAAIAEAARDDCLPAMRFGVHCVDGHRRHAATYEDACRVFDDAVRATLAKRGGQS